MKRERFEGQMKTDTVLQTTVCDQSSHPPGYCQFAVRSTEGSLVTQEYCFTATCFALRLFKSFFNEI